MLCIAIKLLDQPVYFLRPMVTHFHSWATRNELVNVFFLVSTFFSIGASIVDLERGYLVNKHLQDIQEMNIDKSTIEAMKIIKRFLDLKLRAGAYKYKQRSHWFP